MVVTSDLLAATDDLSEILSRLAQRARSVTNAEYAAISTFDDPSDITPVIQVGIEGLQPWVNHIAEMPIRPSSDAPWQKNIVSNQHPDHDTEVWPPAKTPG